jgi:hypothetical protein
VIAAPAERDLPTELFERPVDGAYDLDTRAYGIGPHGDGAYNRKVRSNHWASAISHIGGMASISLRH